MTLSCTKPWNSNSHGLGIFISQVTITAVEDISDMVLTHLDKAFDIGIKLTLDIGKDFQPEFLIAGNFKRDPLTDEVIGWGSGFLVQEALTRLGYDGRLAEGNAIPPEVLEFLIGKSFYRLSYVSGVKENGKLRYSDWNHIASLDEGAEDLLRRFKRSVSSGYPRNYKPFLERETVSVPPEAASAMKEDDPF